MMKAMGLVGALVVLMSGCGPANSEVEQPAAVELGQRTAAIGPGQAWLTTYYADPAKTRVIGACDGCSNSCWGQTSIYSTNSIITCVSDP